MKRVITMRTQVITTDWNQWDVRLQILPTKQSSRHSLIDTAYGQTDKLVQMTRVRSLGTYWGIGDSAGYRSQAFVPITRVLFQLMALCLIPSSSERTINGGSVLQSAVKYSLAINNRKECPDKTFQNVAPPTLLLTRTHSGVYFHYPWYYLYPVL